MKTNCNRFGWIMAVLAMIPTTGFAQSEADKVNERLEKIEQQLTQQQTTISSLRSEIEAVTKQNLALKKNLNLTPTIAKAKFGDNMEYRVIEVTGDPTTQEVHVVMSANTTAPEDKEVYYFAPSIVDELGNGYDDENRAALKIKGVEDNIIKHTITHHPNAPYTIDLNIKKYNPEAQYIKHLSLVLMNGIRKTPVTFENLPIKWVAED